MILLTVKLRSDFKTSLGKRDWKDRTKRVGGGEGEREKTGRISSLPKGLCFH